MGNEIIAEYGSAFPVRFADASMVSMHDAEGNEIEIPTCDICKNSMSILQGKESFKWLCQYCGLPSPSLIYIPPIEKAEVAKSLVIGWKVNLLTNCEEEE